MTRFIVTLVFILLAALVASPIIFLILKIIRKGLLRKELSLRLLVVRLPQSPEKEKKEAIEEINLSGQLFSIL
jgi:hypothetical protein